MIGLGSNRLTVCRRGGMSVTQAGRGGMEWLGVRGPSWASPYSAQATAALLAQFPTQWPTIRDYGFAHPEWVPYINEDPMLVMSLIEGLGTRYITNGSGAYIDTGLVPTNQTSIDALYYASNSNCYVYGSAVDYSTRTMEQYGSELHFGVYKGGLSGLYGAWVHLWSNVNEYYWTNNGTNYSTSFGAYSGTFPYTMGLFALHRASWIASPGTISMQYYKMSEGGTLLRYMVPFKSQTYGNCMLDVVNREVHENIGSGSFTISETPAS